MATLNTTPLVLTHLDNQNDDPRIARDQIYQIGVRVNQIIAALGNLATVNAGDGLAIVNGRLIIDVGPADDVTIDQGTS